MTDGIAMSYKIGFTQNQGRHAQQDCLWNGKNIYQKIDVPPKEFLFEGPIFHAAVCDGISMSPYAEKASKKVMKLLSEELRNGKNFDNRLLRQIHGFLCDALASRANTFGSATTLAAVQCKEGLCTVMNVGDSRVYKITGDGQWEQLSHDHTLINAMIARGEAKPGIRYARMYDALDSYLAADHEEIDFAIHRREAPFLPGDSLLVCTDGVHDVLGDANLQSLYRNCVKLSSQIDIWRKAILSAGAPDNFSIILVKNIGDLGTVMHGCPFP